MRYRISPVLITNKHAGRQASEQALDNNDSKQQLPFVEAPKRAPNRFF